MNQDMLFGYYCGDIGFFVCFGAAFKSSSIVRASVLWLSLYEDKDCSAIQLLGHDLLTCSLYA